MKSTITSQLLQSASPGFLGRAFRSTCRHHGSTRSTSYQKLTSNPHPTLQWKPPFYFRSSQRCLWTPKRVQVAISGAQKTPKGRLCTPNRLGPHVRHTRPETGPTVASAAAVLTATLCGQRQTGLADGRASVHQMEKAAGHPASDTGAHAE